MQRFIPWTAFVGCAALIFLGGCHNQSSSSSSAAGIGNTTVMAADMPASPLASVTAAIAVLHPLGDSKAMGIVNFTQTAEGVVVVADITGLTPGEHAFHIHEFGDCSDPKGMSAGGHYNPEHEPHGLPTAAHHHPGDMGNLNADADGHAHLEIVLYGVTLAGDRDPILGRSVIVHAKPDDGSQPVGNAGGRVACGVIGIAKPK
jgi:Cu-Zn family superoxide dismutase